MLKKWPILVMTLAMAGVANAAYNGTPTAKENFATETINKKECYKIGSAEDLYGFAAIVNGGEYSVCGVLTQNITVNENVLTSAGELNIDLAEGFTPWTPIGNTNFSTAFKGTFYGQGHTISGLYFNDSETDYVGLFAYTFSSGTLTIDGVGVVDSYFRGRDYVGGLVGYHNNQNSQKLSVNNSYNTGSVNGANYVGGLVGGNLKSLSIVVKNSYNTGSVNGSENVGGLIGSGGDVYFSYNTGSVTGNDNVGGLVGSARSNKIIDCYNVGPVKEGDGVGNALLGEGCEDVNANMNNSYYLEGSGNSCGPSSFSGTTEEFANGYVALELHYNTAADAAAGASIWGQVVGADKTPTLTGEIRFLLKDGCFEIASKEDLYLFAAVVNKGVDSKVCAKLTADIKVNENVLADANGVPKVNSDGAYTSTDSASFRKWTPIGNSDHPFIGTFDGDGHTISGLYFNDDTKKYVGLFGYVESSESVDVSIKNVGLEDSYFKAEGRVGGVVGLVGDNVDVKIENVYNAAVVTDGGSGYVGGIVGVFWAYDSPSALNILNSYNSGAVFGKNSVGGLVGDVDDETSASTVSIKNSYNYGAVTAFDNQGETLIGSVAGTSVNISDTYYLKNSALQSTHGGTEMSSTQFADGTVYAALHSAKDGDVWFQKPGDKFPTLSQEKNGPVVYEVTLNYPKAGSSLEYDPETISYVDGIAKSLPTMDKDGNPILGWYASGKESFPITEIPATATGAMTLFPKMYVPAADGCYEIADANQLYLFAAVVNGGKSKSTVCGKLTANICVNACGEGESVLKADGSLNGYGSSFTPWTPIGIAGNPFIGTFDGQGHTISGLYFNDASASNVGLFGYVSGEDETVSISNVGVEDSYFKANSAVGGVVGWVNYVALDMENVYNAAVVVGASFVGGVVGSVNLDAQTLSMVNVYNVGSVIGSDEGQTGGLVGYFMNDSKESKITIENSYNYGNFVGGNPLVGKVEYEYEYENVSVTNSFYLGDVPNGDYGTAKTAEQFAGTAADGNVLAALQSNADGYIWTQGVKYPKFGTYEPATDGCYEIATASQLYWFAAIVNDGKANACARLTANITVNENVLGANNGNVDAETGAYIGKNASSFIEWTPIGNNEHPFKGKFDGQGYTVSGLYFNGEGVYDVGLFGRVAGDTDGASIENVEVADSYFGNSGEKGDHVGGVVGMVTHGGVVDVKNVSSAAVVVGYNGVGGVVGCVFGNEGDFELNITNAYNVGMVKGSDGVGGLVGDVTIDRAAHKIAINNSYNYGGVSFKMDDGGAPLIGTVVNNGSLATIAVNNSFYLGNAAKGDYGTNKTATEFADGTVLTALRDYNENDVNGSVWVQSPGDKHPTLNVNAASANNYTIVLDWTKAEDQVNLKSWLAKYGVGATFNVSVKSGKQFYADGKIYSGNISTADVSYICDNNKTLYPISGVELETVDDKLVATLDGDSQVAVMIPTDVQVDRVIYKRNITANIYTTVMLPFDVDVANNTSVKGKYTFYKFCGVGSDNLGTIINVASVTTKFKANRPYIMIANADNSEGITFEKVGDSKYTLNTTTNTPDVTKNGWTMHGVYEYKVWPEGDSDLGYVYGFASKAGSDNQIGEFVKVGSGADIVPMRMYLKETGPQSVRGNGKYNYSSHTGPAKVVRVQIVEGDGDDETTAIKHVATVPTVVKSNRWFDVKGRALNGKPTAKGTYYYNGQRVIIK